MISFAGHAVSYTSLDSDIIDELKNLVNYILRSITDGFDGLSILYLFYNIGKSIKQLEIIVHSQRKHDT